MTARGVFAVLVVIAACGQGRTQARGDSALEHSCDDVRCPPDHECRRAACVPSSLCDAITCPERGTVCSQGRCVPSMADEDGDGYPAFQDCDDRDPDVTPGSIAPCATWCGEGVSTCQAGGWTACTAPVDCTCASGQQRREPCGVCAEAIRECDGRLWNRVASACEAAGECAADTTGVRDCGQCLVETRRCDEECHWGEWAQCETRALAAGELCNDFDDDCDGRTDEDFDDDADGVATCAGDCNDADADVHPGARDVANGVDDDCDGALDEDEPVGGGS